MSKSSRSVITLLKQEKTCLTGSRVGFLFLIALMTSVSARSEPEQSFIDMLNAVQQSLSGEGLKSSGEGSTGNGTGGGGTDSSGPTAKEYWVSDVDSIAQGQCKTCHQQGGQAGGTRLLFTGSAEDNHLAMQSFVTSAGGSADLVLSKITGGAGHGGGRVISPGSNQYQAFEQYFLLLGGGTAVGGNEAGDFWEGLVIESPETTLRRASLLLSGKVARPDAIARATTSEEALKGEIIKLMRGDAFHDFLISGADDRLLTDGLENGADFSINTEDRYPALTEFQSEYPNDAPDDVGYEKPFLTRGDIDWEFRWAIHREPLELIAHVVETNQSYKRILTADYTMVNPISSIAYRSEVSFDIEYVDESGHFSRRMLNTFKPGKNRGHIAWDDEFEFNYDTRLFESFSDYQEWPHAGVLSTQAWLARYPSTDTNRNRARARWTYFHFLGVDIEKSAPRTTDPVALADTNNPTMNNSACTVCHQRMDPLAGAYQLFGDKGHFKDQYGGVDSLARSYLFPEEFGEADAVSLYQEGDTWYRDMREPGFEDKKAPRGQDSLQWLAHQISEDPRFAAATVKFWWPAIFGADPLAMPEDTEGPDYGQRMRAYNAQESLVAELTDRFIDAEYRAKELLADMIMSPWYRVSGTENMDDADARDIELSTVGSGRLLTPEELDRKNRAVFGRTWGQQDSAHLHSQGTNLDESHGSYKTFYGGTDSAVVVRRNRQMTPMMSSVSENMAVDLACQAVGYDFSLPPGERTVFDIVDRDLLPGDLVSRTEALPGQLETHSENRLVQEPIELAVSLVGGKTKIFLADATANPWESTDAEDTQAEITVQSITFKRGGEVALQLAGEDLPEMDGFTAERWSNDEGESGWKGYVDHAHAGWTLWMGGAWMAFEADLPPGDYVVEVQLATRLWRNNVNNAMRLALRLSALENVDQTRSSRQFHAQMSSLYKRATHRELSSDRVSRLVALLVEHAAEQEGNSWRDNAHCDWWQIWSDWEDVPPEEEYDRFHDPRGVIRGWTMIAHSILSSAAYLHD